MLETDKGRWSGTWAGGSSAGGGSTNASRLGGAGSGSEAAERDEERRARSQAWQLAQKVGYRLDPLLRWWEDTRSNLIRGWHRGRAARKHGN